MSIVPAALSTVDEVSRRIGKLQLRYAGNPLIRRIEHRIAPDWSGEPSVFLNVILSQDRRLPQDRQDDAMLKRLAGDLRLDLLRIVHSEDIGLHSYLNFVSNS